MGCDYYKNVYIDICWKVPNNEDHYESVKLYEQKGWFCGGSEDDYDVELQKWMRRVESNSRKTLYLNGEWKITSEERIEYYKSICEKHAPKDGVLVVVTKYSSCWER